MSYAVYSAKHVERSCKEWLAALAEDIDRRKEEAIRKAMTKPRWFGKQWSREEAIKYLSTSEPISFSEFEIIEMTGWRDKECVQALLVLAKSAPKGNDSVNLSSSDAYILQNFL